MNGRAKPRAMRLSLASLLLALELCAADVVGIGTSGMSVFAGASGHEEIDELRANEAEHERESAEACQHFFCGSSAAGGTSSGLTMMTRHALSHGPLVDTVSGADDEFQSIYVTDEPLFSAEECERVVAMAEREGAGLPSTKSGKYRVGKAWVKDMPNVLAWFNGALEQKLYPALAHLFPTIVSSPATLRAHSVAILKYNESHPATDVHIDDALLAFTIALSPSSNFEGGGTFFEALDTIIPMEQGMVTFRPGAIRHAGHAVTKGLRYVLGGFIAVSDKVEHIRRLNERGNRLLLLPSPNTADLERAARLFAYGLRLNTNCSLCHANRGDALLRLERPIEAEIEQRAQIALLPRDSDAHFALGVALRAQGRTEEAVQAYRDALAIQPQDFDAWVNLAAALADLQLFSEEANAYAHATALRPEDPRPWLNLGEARLSAMDEDGAEDAFRRAAAVSPKDARPYLSLGRLAAKRSQPAEAIELYYQAAVTDPEFFDQVKQGIGTAKAQQGRLAEAVEHFQSAMRMDPKNDKLRKAVEDVEKQAALLTKAEEGLSDRAVELCGTPCRDVVDTSGYNVCAVTWREGCGDVAPPQGFSADSIVGELCELSCAFYLLRQGIIKPAEEESPSI